MSYRSRLHMVMLGRWFEKNTTWGTAKIFCLGTYFVLMSAPFLSFSAMVYRCALYSAALRVMSKHATRSPLYA